MYNTWNYKATTTPSIFSDMISLYPSISLLKSPWMLSPAFPRQRPVASLVVLLSLIRLPHGLGFVDHAIDLRIAQTTAAADGDGLLLACKMIHIRHRLAIFRYKKSGKWYMNKCWVDADYDFCRAKMEIYWDMATNMRWLLGNSPAKWPFSAKHNDELTSGFGSPSFANHISRVLSFPMDPNTSWEGTANPREKIPQTLPKKAFGSIGRERYI